MNFQRKMKALNRQFREGRYGNVVKECGGLLEQALRQLFRKQIMQLHEHDRLRIEKLEQKIGQGRQGVEQFTMAQLLSLFHSSRILDAWELSSGKKLNSVRAINIDELARLGNLFANNGTHATRSEAELFLFCLRAILDGFGMATFDETEAVC